MTAASGRPGTAGVSRAADPADRTAEVSWFDIRQISLSRSDLAEMDAREKARAAAFVFPADRHRYQVAHVMLRRVLADHLGTDPSRLVFGRQHCPTCGGPAGKPVLTGIYGAPAREDTASAEGHPRASDGPGTPRGADGAWLADRQAASRTDGDGGQPGHGAWSGVSFSLAHSGEAVAIAVARSRVGIDVEREATGCVCSLASAMHPDDAAIVEVLPEPERHLAVIRWWVRAEAVLKCAGTGIAHGMDAFPVLGAPVRSRVPPGPRLPLEPEVPGWAAVAGCSFAVLSAPKGYQAALALPGLRLIRYRWGPDR
jgi:4'-phosphopantetheinyl transferase